MVAHRRGIGGGARGRHPRPREERLLQLRRGGRGDEGRGDERGAMHTKLPARRPPFDFAQDRPRLRLADDQQKRTEGERTPFCRLRAGCYKPGACPERQREGELRWSSGAVMPTDPSTDR